VGFLIPNIFIIKIIMGKVVRLTESDMNRLVKRVIKESFNVPGFELVKQMTNGEGDNIDIFGKDYKDFQVLIYTVLKNVNGEDKRVVRVMVNLPGNNKVDINKNAGGKSWIMIKDETDVKLSTLVKAAVEHGALHKFQTDWDNAPSLKSSGPLL
jgi:hypothetical protein